MRSKFISNFQGREKEFQEKIIQVNRVSKKTQGGNRIGFSVLVAVGDKKGKVGVGLGKAPDVASAIKKATSYAKKHLIEVPIYKTTIPYKIRVKFGAAKILLKPAPVGSGLISGGAIRTVLELAGIRDAVSKILGTRNKTTNVYATIKALINLKRHFKKRESKKINSSK